MSNLIDIEPNKVTSSLLDKVFLLYGDPGTRKTSIAVGDIENTLLLAFEIGYKFIPGVYAKDVGSWVQFKKNIRELKKPEVKEKYKTIAIDTIGLAYKACVNYICAQAGVEDIGDIPYGGGYRKAKNEFEKEIHKIPQNEYGLIMVAHSSELDDEKNGVSVKVDLDKRPSQVIRGLADFILYSRKEPKDNNPEEMTVYAYSETKNPNIDVKKRARFFPSRIEFTYENLVEGLKEAIEKQNKFFNTESSEEPSFKGYKEKDEEVSLEDLQEEITTLATQLFDTSVSNQAKKILKDGLDNVRVSQTTKNHIPVLYSIRDRLEELKKGL